MAHLTRERLEREHNVRVIDLADATGYSASYISLILSGSERPRRTSGSRLPAHSAPG